MTALALVLAMAAACFNAAWNVLLKTGGDPIAVSVRAVTSSLLLSAPAAAVAWLVTGRPGVPGLVWLLVALSGLAELTYFICLSEAYRRGELSSIYPMVRGVGPLVAIAAGLLVLREHVRPLGIVAVILLLSGIWIVRRPTAAGAATLPALLAGLCVGTYTAIDRVGVQHTVPWLYVWLIWCSTGSMLAAWSLLARWRILRRVWGARAASGALSTFHRRDLLVGLSMASSYSLVLFALRLAPVVLVAPAREAAIVLVSGWGIWRLRERQGAGLRAAGALVILGGLILLVL